MRRKRWWPRLFRSIYLKTLRDLRTPILGWGFGLGVLLLVVVLAIPTVIATPDARASLVAIGPTFAWLAEPIKIDTPGGYTTFKYGLTILVVALWPILTETAMLRGEEQRGSMNALLSLPVSRARVAVEKVLAVWTALALFAVIVAILAYSGTLKISGAFNFADALMYSLNIALISAFFGAIGLLLSQFFHERRTAAGATAIVLLVSIIVDMVHRVVANSEWISRFSPVYYYNLSRPLIPGYGTNFGAMLLIASLTLVLSAAAIYLFARRDIDDVVEMPRSLRLPVRAGGERPGLLGGDWSLRSVYARSLATLAVPTIWWTLAIAGFAAWMVDVVKMTVDQLTNLLEQSPILKAVFKLSGAPDDASILSGLFIFMPLLLMAFAVTQANRWASDEEDGRFDLVLATPQSRLTVLFGRFGAVATATVFVALMTLAGVELTAAGTGVTLDAGHVVAATLSMIPMGLLVAALGYLFSGWLKTAMDTGLLSFVLVIWFVISFIGPGLKWPDATQHLSAFYYYGTPLVNGFSPLNIIGVLVVAAAALAVAAARFARKDITA